MHKVYLLRHGETNNNLLGLDGKFAHDQSLNDLGKKQSFDAAKRLKLLGAKPDAIVSSALKRTIETAEIISEVTCVQSIVDPRLNETNMGLWQDAPIRDILLNYASLEKLDKASFRPPGGESWNMVADRLLTYFNGIEEMGYNEIILVGHQGPFQILMQALLKQPPEALLEGIALKNGEFVILEKGKDGWEIKS